MRASLARRIILATAALLALPIASPAQQSAQQAAQQATPANPSATFSVDTRLVNIPVVVRDDKGKLILNLKKDDFSLQVDGRPQTIRYFDLDTDLPLTLGLLVDTSGSVRNVLDEERTASSAFLDQMLATKDDKAFLIQFSRSVELLQDVTGSRPKLQAALKQIDTQPPDRSAPPDNNPDNSPDSNSRNGNQRGGNRGRMGFRGGTTLYDAVFLASDEVMSKQKGRKAIVLLTDGVDRGSKESLASAIEAAQRSDSIVYAIYFKGEQPGGGGDRRGGGGGRRGGIGFPGGGGGYPGGGGGYPGGRGGGGRGGSPEQQVDGKKILERMTQETGGRMFEVSKKETVAHIYDQIGQELRSQYRLGFTPEGDTAAEGYHKIDLAFTSKDKNKLTIQTRDGYYTGK
jgi:VWFA-related protein